MHPAKRKWIGIIAACALPAVCACRDREPVPAYNENLGSAERPLLPAHPTLYDPELGKSNKKVEIPKRPEPGTPSAAEKPEPAQTGAEAEAEPGTDNAATHGVTPGTGDLSTIGE